MTSEQNLVAHWMQTFGQSTPTNPCIPNASTRKLRATLILEEAIEACVALGFVPEIFFNKECEDEVELDATLQEIIVPPNLHQIADALAGLHYVGYCGTGVACGINMEPVFQEVHKTNMAKLWSKEEVDHVPLPGVLEKDLVAYEYKGKYVVKNSVGKIIKPPSWKPPEFKCLNLPTPT